jgi:hypothetical protein
MGRAGWGALSAFLIVLATSCSSAAPVVRTPAQDISDARPLARELADILLNFSVYDYAFVGALNGDRVRVVPAERYAAVARVEADVIADNATRIIAAVVNTAGPVHDRLVTLADSMGQLRADALAYSDARQPAAFARVIADVNANYRLLRELQSLLKDDSILDATITRGMAMRSAAAPGSGALVTAGPYATAADAAAIAKQLGAGWVATTESPFVVRSSYKDRASADAAVAALAKQQIVGLVIDQTSYVFSRTGPAPDAELWREPERFIDTHSGARKIALSVDAKLVATGSDDGVVAIFTNDGVLRSLPKANAGVNQLIFSIDARFLMGGGQVLSNFVLPRPTDSVGVPMRLRNATQSLVYIPKANAFAASSGGENGGGGIIGGRAPDGIVLGAPFPIEVGNAGAILGASDAGELFIATPVGAAVELRVLRVGLERFPRGILRVNGAMRAFAVDPSGSYGAIVTDQGTFLFAIKAADPSKTVVKVAPVARDVEFGRDNTLYVLEAQKVSAISTDGTARWSAPLVDGRRLVVGLRAVVLDGTDRLITFGPDGTQDLLAPVGQVLDLVVSGDGNWIGVIADARRAVLFRLQ